MSNVRAQVKRTSIVLSLVLAATLGVAACWAFVSLLGLFTLHVWFPLFRHHWPLLGGGDPSHSYEIATAFSAVFSAAVSALFTFAISRVAALRSPGVWFAYAAGFLLCLLGPLMFDPMEGLIRFLLVSPDIWSFLAASAFSHWLLTKGPHRAVRVEP
jgi:hypothetical protein